MVFGKIRYESPAEKRRKRERRKVYLSLGLLFAGISFGHYYTNSISSGINKFLKLFEVPQQEQVVKPKKKTIKKVVKADPKSILEPELPALLPTESKPLEKIVEPKLPEPQKPIPASTSYSLDLTVDNIISDTYQSWKVPERIKDYVGILQVNQGVNQDEHLQLYRKSAVLAKSKKITDKIQAYYGFQYLFYQRDDSTLSVSHKMRSSYMRAKILLDLVDHYQEKNKVFATRLTKLASRIAYIHKKFYPKFKYNQKLEEEIEKRR